ncbi:MAG: phosphoglycolate phosphatase [Desulfurococcaceae archaeon]
MIRIVFADVDGTLTIDRRSYALDVDAINAIRKLAERGVLVSLVSSNSVPLLVGLRRYLGAKGPVVAETGAVVFSEEWGVLILSKRRGREAFDDVMRAFGNYLEEGWQNPFMFVELTFKIKREHIDRGDEIFEAVREYVKHRHKDYKVDYSKYAIHLLPSEVDKGLGVREVLTRLAVRPDEAVAVGDSYMDAAMYRHVKYRAAVSNADEELRREANVLLNNPSGKGFAELAEMIIAGAL